MLVNLILEKVKLFGNMYVKTSLDVARTKDAPQHFEFHKERLKMFSFRDFLVVILVLLSGTCVVLLNRDESGKALGPDNTTNRQGVVDKLNPPVNRSIDLENVNVPLLLPRDEASFNVENVLHSVNVLIESSKKSKLPTAKEIDDVFDSKPIVSGLNQCIRYQHSVVPTNRVLAPVGLFNVVSESSCQSFMENRRILF